LQNIWQLSIGEDLSTGNPYVTIKKTAAKDSIPLVNINIALTNTVATPEGEIVIDIQSQKLILLKYYFYYVAAILLLLEIILFHSETIISK
jgi:hypothetical protein